MNKNNNYNRGKDGRRQGSESYERKKELVVKNENGSFYEVEISTNGTPSFSEYNHINSTNTLESPRFDIRVYLIRNREFRQFRNYVYWYYSNLEKMKFDIVKLSSVPESLLKDTYNDLFKTFDCNASTPDLYVLKFTCKYTGKEFLEERYSLLYNYTGLLKNACIEGLREGLENATKRKCYNEWSYGELCQRLEALSYESATSKEQDD
jgi:hypothetical protein